MTELYVKVKPDAGEFDIEPAEIPNVALESKAENGRANQELKRRLKDITGSEIGIVSGHKSRRKKIVTELSEDSFRQKIGEYNG